MSIEELLKPRYKVIADYPNNPFKVGDIIPMIGKCRHQFAQSEDEPEMWRSEFIESKKGSTMYYDSTFIPYPHLFKPLAWYEERKIEDMPEYVRGYHKHKLIGNENQVVKVSWRKENGVVQLNNVDRNDGLWFDLFLYELTPATEQDYLNYLNLKA